MDSIIIRGGRRLGGEINVQGSKNSSLPILAATVLVKGISVIHNCPYLTDVDAAIEILRHLGCIVKRENHTVTVDSRFVSRYEIPDSLMREMRSSIVFLGSILGRMGQAVLSSPGGCEIGLRPIDLHLSSLRKLGFAIDETGGKISCRKQKTLTEGIISLSFPSVGATENIMLACALSGGRTVILNAAREPEISDLAAFLNSAGCRIEVGSQGTVVIDGVKRAGDCEHTVIPDRIAALTYLCAAGAAGGDILLKNVDFSDFLSVIPVFEAAGCTVQSEKNTVRLMMNDRPKAVRDIRTMPYPGFPTDAQAPVMAMVSIARGTSVIVENIFESRFKHVGELKKMGAKINVEGRVAVIDGVRSLYGAHVESPDLRGGSALVVAGLVAEGITTVGCVSHIDRGYEKIEDCLKSVGADIERQALPDS
ncbi:MAG: UDP-N-acetylglucosamine 1-carboxyvinyltransferase [Clostridia bacterium]|nr:UDP-N-acetylglucosamine 1-carboxyvinyltransferase [Clostridia bacterium]